MAQRQTSYPASGRAAASEPGISTVFFTTGYFSAAGRHSRSVVDFNGDDLNGRRGNLHYCGLESAHTISIIAGTTRPHVSRH